MASPRASATGVFPRLNPQPTAGENLTGLGLSIVLRWVEAMSGNVGVESGDRAGSSFFIDLSVSATAGKSTA